MAFEKKIGQRAATKSLGWPVEKSLTKKELEGSLASDSDYTIKEINNNEHTSDNIKLGTFVLIKYMT